jgi:hypothetical protein
MRDFQLYIEKYFEKQPNAQAMNVNIKYILRDFLQSEGDLQVLFLVHHLIVEAGYKEGKEIYDFIVFIYPSAKYDKERLMKMIELALNWF